MPNEFSMKTENTALLAIENVTVGYGNGPVVNQVSFDAPAGQITVLVGPNGCGKSTLLKAAARILKPDAGEVLLDNQRVHDMPTRAVAKRMALLPQGPIVPEGLTVRELVAQGRFPHQTLLRQWSDEDSHAVARAMEETDTAQFADRPVATLSGGQRQRCWIAMVLAQDTEIILLDEPTTFLDLKVQIDVMSLLSRIAHNQGRTLVVVLHELNIAAAFADNMVMMHAGKIVASDSPKKVMTSANLKKVFDLDARVITDPDSGRPVCLPHVLKGAA